MGYTHYWVHPELTIDDMAALVEDIRNIILASELPIAGWDGSGEPELGIERISFNGAGADSHETFQITPAATEFDFCKTARAPYDVVVTASLVAAKDRLGDRFTVTTDGWRTEWNDGLELAERATARNLKPAIEAIFGDPS